MIYDSLLVALLPTLATQRSDATNAAIARHLIEDGDPARLSVRGVAAACGVGVGSVSRFCHDVGFESFEALRDALAGARREFARASTNEVFSRRTHDHARIVAASLQQAADSVSKRAIDALVADIRAYGHVCAYGLLKAQAAAIDLQVDLLMLGKRIDTCVSYAEQLDHIARARRDELIVIFSYTGDYFGAHDLTHELARIDRPRIWMVCGRSLGGATPRLPDYVADAVTFASGHDQLSHPFQLQMVSAIIAQEYARTDGDGEAHG